MSGTINIALQQQQDMDGRPLSGGFLYTFHASTDTPQTVFEDAGLTLPMPNPMKLDASGRVPMFYADDGSIKIRLTDKNGVVVIAIDNMLVVGPSSGGGGGGAGVNPDSVLQVGDIKARFGIGTIDGWVRCNGGTIGNTLASAATELQDPTAQALFEYLWSTGVCAVIPTRGATANADWAANKAITLPDFRGRALTGMDDMGTGPANILTAALWGADPTVLGNKGGAQSHTLVADNLPPHTHAVNGTSDGEAGHTHSLASNATLGENPPYHLHGLPSLGIASFSGYVSGGGLGADVGQPFYNVGAFVGNVTNTSVASGSDHSHNLTGNTSAGSSHTHPINFTSGSTPAVGAGSQAFGTTSPGLVITVYMKL